MRPRAIDTSNGFFDLVSEIYRAGQEDGRRTMTSEVASKAGNASRIESFKRQAERWLVYERYFRGTGRKATKEDLQKLQGIFAAKKIPARSFSTIRADIRKWRPHRAKPPVK